MKRFTRPKLLLLAAPLVLALGLLAGTLPMMASATAPPAPPGQSPCSHGNTGKVCRPDPSQNGKDCQVHGNNGVGGVNEDHCLAQSTTTVETTPVTTTTGETIPVTTSTVATTLPETTTNTETTTAVVTESTPVETTTASNAPTTPAVSNPGTQASPAQPTQRSGVAGVHVSKKRAVHKVARHKAVRKAKAQPKRSHSQVKAAHSQVNAASIRRVHALPFTP